MQIPENVDVVNESVISLESLNQLVVDLSMITVMLARHPVAKTLKSVKSFFDKVWDYIIDLGQYCSRVDIVVQIIIQI